MVSACLTVANSTDYKPVWTGNPPADFGTDMAQLQTNYGNITVLAARADAATGGGDRAGKCRVHACPRARQPFQEKRRPRQSRQGGRDQNRHRAVAQAGAFG